MLTDSLACKGVFSIYCSEYDTHTVMQYIFYCYNTYIRVHQTICNDEKFFTTIRPVKSWHEFEERVSISIESHYFENVLYEWLELTNKTINNW